MKKAIVLVMMVGWLLKGGEARAEEAKKGYVTIVNPIRKRELWVSKEIDCLKKQYEIIDRNEVKATWLMQYEVMKDEELVRAIRNFNKKQELGLFLEISPELAKEAKVIYNQQRPWYKPDVVFLSGYSRKERKRLIDKMFYKFEELWGRKPKSVGAWWIDSWSIEYMRKKYGIKIALIVADQKTTDNYGVWGQWWGAPYKASENNILVPGEKGLVIIQWALRDPKRAVGEGREFSNYSLQANDYLERGLTTDYFVDLAKKYLEASGQITVGLEVGMEGAKNLAEYERQIEWLGENGETVTMSQFEERFKQPEKVTVGNFEMSKEKRINRKTGEEIKYEKDIVFGDYFVADKNDFLDRRLPLANQKIGYTPYWLVVAGGGAIVAGLKRQWKWWLGAMFFLALTFGELMRSGCQWGWWVFYGPKMKNLEMMQTGVAGGVMGIFWLLRRKKELIKGMVLAGGVWVLIGMIRVSIIEGEYWLGMLADGFRFVGIGMKRGIRWLNLELEPEVAGALWRFKWERVWQNWWSWMIGVPVLQGLIGWGWGQLRGKKKAVGAWLMTGLVAIRLWQVIGAEPSFILAVTR